MPMGEIQPESDRINESLKSLGLTKYEALVYMALLQVQGATATEIHEISKVPRASVYPVIDKLITKNLVSISNTSPKRFSATPPDAAVKNMLGSIKKDADIALKALTELYEARPERSFTLQECIWSISGEENITLKLREALLCAREEILFISKWDFIKKSLFDIIVEVNQKVKIEIITNKWDAELPSNISVNVFRDHNEQNSGVKNSASGVYIIDKKKVMLIMDSEFESANPPALYSESYGFVRFFTSYWNFVHKHLKDSHSNEKIPVK
jgi:sugar-specific transcriptional regulator TrmB